MIRPAARLLLIPTLALVAAAALCAVPAPAAAQYTDEDVPSESRKYLSTGLTFGWLKFADSSIGSVYGDKARFMTKLHLGVVPWSQYVHVEINAGVGFIQFSGKQGFVSSSGTSGENIMLTLFPLTVDLLVGIDLVEEQPVVPYGGVGLNWTLWREHDVSHKWTGDRLGGSVFFGGAILLDTLERRRASQLDAVSGINDSFLTLEGRYSKVNAQYSGGKWNTDLVEFGGWSFQVGIKLII